MTFDFTPTDSGLRIHDQIENVWTDIDAGGRVDPEPASTDVFPVPLDDAVHFETSKIKFGQSTAVRVLNEDGHPRDVVGVSERKPLDTGTYLIDVGFHRIPSYIWVADAALTIDKGGPHTTLDFDSPTTVVFGVRSLHEHPAGIISTTRNPEDVAAVVSTFGNAKKSFSPEGSFATLRGHPPEVVLSSELRIPSELSPPDTDIRIGVPPKLSAIFTVAPLAYYLGAIVTITGTPFLEAGDRRYELDAASFYEAVLSVLRRIFLFDSIIRTEGLYPVELKERRIFESRVSMELEDLYEQPMVERLNVSLTLPDSVFEGFAEWQLLTDLPAQPRSVELLPYLVYRLSGIRSPPKAKSSTPLNHPGTASLDEVNVRFGSTPPEPLERIEPESAPVRVHQWAGGGIPIGAHKPTTTAYVAGLDDTPSQDEISIRVVCNDPEMTTEVENAYEGTGFQKFSISLDHDLETAELRDLLTCDTDFLHFAGHVDQRGLRCPDGHLDTTTLESSGVRSFLLNGCTSAKQGLALLNAGSVFGIVTTKPVHNEDAVRDGRTIARFLELGYTPSDSLRIIKEAYSSTEYSVIGDAFHRLCIPVNPSVVLSADRADVAKDAIRVTYSILPNGDWTLGGLFTTDIAPSTHFLNGEHNFVMTRAFNREHGGDSPLPLITDNTLYWTDELEETGYWKRYGTPTED